MDSIAVWLEGAAPAAGFASLLVSVAALAVAVAAWRRSDRNTSAGTLIALFEAFRQGWDRFVDEPDLKRRTRYFHDLMNNFEVASAIHQDLSVHGASRELLEDYLLDTLRLIAADRGARSQISAMRGDPKVFKYLRRFLLAMRLRGHPEFSLEIMVSPEPERAGAPSSKPEPEPLAHECETDSGGTPVVGMSRPLNGG
nr:hypothetical protein [uncultured Brevundimonas sp.]